MRGSIFRTLRAAMIALVLITCTTWLLRSMTSLKSEQAVINAEIMQVRTPIEGVLEMNDVRPGMMMKKGDLLFKIKNPRFGDRESVSQFNGLQNMVETVRSDLLAAKHLQETAEVELARSDRLYARKLIPLMELEEDRLKLEIARSLVKARHEQLTRSENRAAEMGAQMQMQKESLVLMPEDGLIWSIEGKTGEQLDTNKPVLEIINPARIWVDAFFSEKHASQLKTGLPAQIRSLDSESFWEGHLQSVRAGVGRLSYDTTVAVPPPEMAKRQIAVRIESEWQYPFSTTEFFGVGRSVEVVFRKKALVQTKGDQIREACAQTLAKIFRGPESEARP